MKIFLWDVWVVVFIEDFEGILGCKGGWSEPLFYFLDCGFNPIEFLWLDAFVVTVDDGAESFIIDNFRVGFIHVVEDIIFLILAEGDNLVDIFKPTLTCDKSTTNFIKFSKKIINTNLFFDSFFSKFY